NTPSCKGTLPESAYVNAPIWGSDAGTTELKLLSKVQRQQENHEPIRQDQQENHEPIPQNQRDFMLKERWLIWMPRFGLGNSLRAYTSAFIFALLSGRRLLRWHGGNHKQVLDRLCNAFYCGIDELQYKGDIGRHAKLMDSRKLEVHGFDYSPNVVAVYSGKFFDRLWRGDHQMNQCVHDTFSCTSLWCIRSKVLSLLLGKGPRPGMQEVVDRDLRVVPPLVLRGEAGGMKEGGVTEGKVEPQMVKKGEGLRLQFDVALHIRGHAIHVEGDYCVNKDKKCQEKAQKGEQIREHAYMKPRQWRCIARLMQFLRIKKAAAAGFTNAAAAAGRSPNATTAAGGFTNATAAADGSANAIGSTVGVVNGQPPHAEVNAATESSK
ncbi:unnamed protein product, partial [Closterium sp. Naga37s-1]